MVDFSQNSEISFGDIISMAGEINPKEINIEEKIEPELEIEIIQDIPERSGWSGIPGFTGTSGFSAASGVSETFSNKQAEEKVENVDIDSYDIEEILYAMPLEPCVLFVQTKNPKNLVTYEAKGIPGFIDVEHKRFFLLNGEQINSTDFNNKFKNYIDKELNQQLPKGKMV